MSAQQQQQAAALAAQQAQLGMTTNPLLLDARLHELLTALRQLISSQKELETALLSDPNDVDFRSAITENDVAIEHKREEAAGIVRALRQSGVSSYADVDLPRDVWDYVPVVKTSGVHGGSPPSDTAGGGQGRYSGGGEDDNLDGGLYL